MTIKFDPQGLRTAIECGRLNRGTKREGYLTFEFEGAECPPPVEGMIGDLYEEAVVFNTNHPEGTVTIHEHDCTAAGVPAIVMNEWLGRRR